MQKGGVIMRNVAQEVYGSDFRDNQRHFLDFYNKNYERNVIAEMPTGSGKSLIAMHIGLNHPEYGTVFIVTPTKDLMKQYERDFGHLKDVLLLAGKNEYKCMDALNEGITGLTAEACTNDQEPCKYHYSMDNDNNCEYSRRINTFMEYKVVVTNYHMMLALINLKNTNSRSWYSPLIIWDEAHKFQDILRNITGIEYNKDKTTQLMNRDLAYQLYLNDYVMDDSYLNDEISNDLYSYFYSNFKDKSATELKNDLTKWFETINIIDHNAFGISIKEKLRILRDIDGLRSKVNGTILFRYMKAEPYEVINKDNRESCIRLIPQDYTDLATKLFSPAAEKHLMMSGTIHYPQFNDLRRLELLKIINGMEMDIIYKTPNQYYFSQDKIKKYAPHHLDWIIYRNSIEYVDFKKAYGKMIKIIIEKDLNTMIHFNAKWQCNHMEKALKESGYQGKIYNYHDQGNTTESKQKIKKEFIKTGGVLIGSSLHEGLDFPGEQLELVIIGRAPYAPDVEKDKYYPRSDRKISSKIVRIWEGLKEKGALNIDKEEYRLKTLQQIGRLQRTNEDKGIIILANYPFVSRDIQKQFVRVQ